MIFRPNEPSFCSSKHLDRDALDEAFSCYQSQNSGCLRLIVIRCADGSRRTPNTVEVSEDRGVHGDRWEHSSKRKIVEQIAVMDMGVAEIFANGQSLTLFGDNLFIEQDWSMWKIGERFLLGSAIFALTAEPHTGCAKFSKRFGSAALKKTVLDREKKLRGVYVHVVRGGTIQVGEVLQRLEAED